MKKALAIRHVAFEGLDGFEPALAEAGYEIRYVEATSGALPEPELAAADLLVVLGGPIGAYEEEAYPFLRVELDVIERRLEAGAPLLGICLGAQLVARAAGARVYPSGAKEIGFAPVRLSPEGADSCLAPFASEPMTLHWHGDTFDLPEGAVRLASTDLCENQAFSIGPRTIGFQFHPEATARNLEHWLVGHAVEIAAAGVDVCALRGDGAKYGGELARKALAIGRTWLAGLDGPG